MNSSFLASPIPRLEERSDALPRYGPEEIPWMRLEACDTCGRCLKAVDLTANPEAEPITDEIAATALDVIAREAGYTKLARNIVGL